MATQTVQKWGNSLAVRIPSALRRRLALAAGSGVVMHEADGALVIRRREQRQTRKGDWARYLIPTKRKRERVSGQIDRIVYGAAR